MRRVNIKTGLKQRLNEILGTDYGTASPEDVYDLTPWSIQSAQLENNQRIVKSIVGDSTVGRIMSGLLITGNVGDSSFHITSGLGFTTSGNIVSLGATTSGIGISSY